MNKNEAQKVCWCGSNHACQIEGCTGRIILYASVWVCDSCKKEYGEDWTDEHGCKWGWEGE